MSDPEPATEDDLLPEAAQWFARMRGPDAEARRGEFDAWLAQGAAHRAAYNRAAEIFALGKLLADDHDADAAKAPQRGPRRPALALAAAGAALLVGGASMWLALQSNPPGQIAGTGIAQSGTGPAARRAELDAPDGPRSVRLADGSVLKLRAGTSIAVDYGREMRTLALTRGSARFYVAHERRPFIVYAGGGTIAAHGTVFDVGLARNHRVIVRLVEGVIDVSLPPRPTKRPASTVPRRLQAGDVVSFDAAPQPASADHPRNGIAAPEGPPGAGPAQARQFDSISLAELVELANQRASKPISIADPAIGRLRISGKFRIDDTELLAERVAALFHLAIDRPTPSSIVLRPM